MKNFQNFFKLDISSQLSFLERKKCCENVPLPSENLKIGNDHLTPVYSTFSIEGSPLRVGNNDNIL